MSRTSEKNQISINYHPQDGSLTVIVEDGRNKFKYGIRGREKNSCAICGRSLKIITKKCTSHKIIEGIDFRLDFGGYYETNKNSLPLNQLTDRFLRLRYGHSENLIKEFAEILTSRLLHSPDFPQIKWGTWIPTTNSSFIKVAKQLYQSHDIFHFPPEKLCSFHPNEEELEKKYQKEPIIESLKKQINNKIGIIVDDLYHKGGTMKRIMEILKDYEIRKVQGLTLVRSTSSKKALLKVFPP